MKIIIQNAQKDKKIKIKRQKENNSMYESNKKGEKENRKQRKREKRGKREIFQYKAYAMADRVT